MTEQGNLAAVEDAESSAVCSLDIPILFKLQCSRDRAIRRLGYSVCPCFFGLSCPSVESDVSELLEVAETGQLSIVSQLGFLSSWLEGP